MTQVNSITSRFAAVFLRASLNWKGDILSLQGQPVHSRGSDRSYLIDVDVLHSGQGECIRLNGIDCPEKGQAYGKRAKQAASELVFGKEVTLNTFGKDKYGRTIADVILPDGTNGLSDPAEQGRSKGPYR